MAEEKAIVDIEVKGQQNIDKTTKSLDKTAASMEKIADNGVKVGKGLAGGFESAAKAASAFDSKAGKAFENVIGKATTFMQVSDGIKDAAEGFTRENLKGLSSIFTGLGKNIKQLFLFKGALIGTGIGALIVGLGTAVAFMAANWEKTVEVVNDLIDVIPGLRTIIDGFSDLYETVGGLNGLLEGSIAFVKGLFTIGADAVEEFNKAVEKSKAIDRLEEEEEALGVLNEQRANAIKLLQEIGKQEEQIFRLQRESTQEAIDKLQERLKLEGSLSEENKKRLSELQSELILIGLRENKWKESLAKEAEEKRKAREKEREEARKQREEEIKFLADRFKDARAEAQERLKQQKEADLNIRQLKINNYKEDRNREIGQVNFDAEQRKAKLVGTEEQIAEQKRLINEKASSDVAKINAKYDKIAVDAAKKREDDIAKGQEEAKKKREDELGEILGTVNTYVGIAGQFADTIFGAVSARMQRDLEAIQAQIGLLDTQYQESTDRINDLNTQLLTADGARRDQLIGSIEAERQVQKKASQERKRLQIEEIKIQNKKNKAEYQQAIIGSIVSGAQAVLQALASSPPPASFILAAVTGALAALQAGVIASNPPKDIPVPSGSYAAGGHTKGIGYKDSTGHEVAGTVHANEYVVPANVLSTPRGRSLVGELETMRQTTRKKFAVGGYTTPNLDAGNSAASTEYLLDAIRNMQPVVAVTEINRVSGNVSAIESTASI